MKIISANRIVPDGTPHFAASHLGLFCLPSPIKRTPGLYGLKCNRCAFDAFAGESMGHISTCLHFSQVDVPHEAYGKIRSPTKRQNPTWINDIERLCIRILRKNLRGRTCHYPMKYPGIEPLRVRQIVL